MARITRASTVPSPTPASNTLTAGGRDGYWRVPCATRCATTTLAAVLTNKQILLGCRRSGSCLRLVFASEARRAWVDPGARPRARPGSGRNRSRTKRALERSVLGHERTHAFTVPWSRVRRSAPSHELTVVYGARQRSDSPCLRVCSSPQSRSATAVTSSPPLYSRRATGPSAYYKMLGNEGQPQFAHRESGTNSGFIPLA